MLLAAAISRFPSVAQIKEMGVASIFDITRLQPSDYCNSLALSANWENGVRDYGTVPEAVRGQTIEGAHRNRAIVRPVSKNIAIRLGKQDIEMTKSEARNNEEKRRGLRGCAELSVIGYWQNLAWMIFLPITYGAGDGHVARIGGFVVSCQFFGRAVGY